MAAVAAGDRDDGPAQVRAIGLHAHGGVDVGADRLRRVLEADRRAEQRLPALADVDLAFLEAGEDRDRLSVGLLHDGRRHRLRPLVDDDRRRRGDRRGLGLDCRGLDGLGLGNRLGLDRLHLGDRLVVARLGLGDGRLGGLGFNRLGLRRIGLRLRRLRGVAGAFGLRQLGRLLGGRIVGRRLRHDRGGDGLGGIADHRQHRGGVAGVGRADLGDARGQCRLGDFDRGGGRRGRGFRLPRARSPARSSPPLAPPRAQPRMRARSEARPRPASASARTAASSRTRPAPRRGG